MNETKLPLTPIGDKILIKEQEFSQKTSSILIADMGNEKPLSGVVISAGPGRLTEYGHFIPTTVKEGDTVFFPRFGAQKITIDNEDFIICREPELLATLNK